MYKCECCGHVQSSSWDCDECGGDTFKARECVICGEILNADEVHEDMCNDCLSATFDLNIFLDFLLDTKLFDDFMYWWYEMPMPEKVTDRMRQAMLRDYAYYVNLGSYKDLFGIRKTMQFVRFNSAALTWLKSYEKGRWIDDYVNTYFAEKEEEQK